MTFKIITIILSLLLSVASFAKSKDLRVAVIGAGASGLTAAYTLKDKGYKNITVYERNDYYGGKVHTLEVAGRTFEFGAVWVPASYKTVHEFIKEFDIKLIDAPPVVNMTIEDNTMESVFAWLFARYNKAEILKSVAATEKLLLSYGQFWKPGFNSKDTDLHMTFAEYLVKHPDIEPLARGLQALITGCGYGFYSETPALYVMKFMKMLVDSPFKGLGGGTKISEAGYQAIWTAVGKTLNVKLSTPVEKIERIKKDGKILIYVTAGGKTEEFDRLVVSSSPDATLKFLDVTPVEKELFSKVKVIPYTVTLFKATNLKYLPAALVMDNVEADKSGHSIIMAQQYKDIPYFQSWRLGRWDTSKEEMDRMLREDVEQLGGTLDEIVKEIRWSYFPHVEAKDLADGFYDKLNALQGQNGTYYVGGIMNFETVEHTAQFAKHLMKKKFK